MANLYVFHQGQLNDGALFWSVYDGANWSGERAVPNLGISDSPSAVGWDNGITVFHQGQQNSGQLWYTYSSNGTNWGRDTLVQDLARSMHE
jgi:hypothetical protein